MLYSSVAFLSSLALSSAIQTAYIPEGAICHDYTIPVTVASNNRPWNGPKWEDDYGFIDFLSSASTRLSAGVPFPLGDPVKQTATYDISATFCTPKKQGENSKTVLLATHGLGFDRSYWNPSYKPEEYNFVQYAIGKGYSVFFYDRLGVGLSTKVSGFSAQLSTQVAILASLAKSVRNGTYTTPSLLRPTALILIGHSFGSFSSNAVLAADPTAADAVILTGYGLAGNAQLTFEGFAPRVARLQARGSLPSFAALDPGYLTTADVFGNIHDFFKAPAYERDVALFSEATKQPFAVAELLSLNPAVLVSLDAYAFRGPALVATGEFDFILCGGYCPGVLEPPLRPLFAGSSNFEVHVQPEAGHGVNFAKNATGFFEVLVGFLGKSGF